MDSEKKCSKCGEVKPVEEYYAYHKGSDRRQGVCKICHTARQRELQVADSAKDRARQEAYRAAHRAEARAVTKAYREAHPDRNKQASAAWRKANPDKAKAGARVYVRAHRAEGNARGAARKARKLRATPVWADKEAMTEVYLRAKRQTELTGVKHHVDHVVPLQAELVCGLHVEFNLAAIPQRDNQKKGNRHWPDMP